MNRSYQDIIDEEFNLPVENICKTPNNKVIKPQRITFPDFDNKTDVSSVNNDINEWHKDLPGRPTSTKAKSLIKKINFLQRYTGRSQELDELE